VALGVLATANATAPCFEVCHLSQSQPLLVEGTVWVRPCTTAKGTQSCVLQRLDFDGRVLDTFSADVLRDEETFRRTYLDNHRVSRLVHQTPWTDLRKPYKLSLEAVTMTLRLDKTTLICERPNDVIKRSLDCKPFALSVRTSATGRDNKLEDPTGVTVVVASCGTRRNPRDVIAVCQAKP
jgi:hypothetical protein